MKLQTQIPLEKQSENVIDYNSKVLLLGSCFAENIGDKFEYYKFQNVFNPFGVLFHPEAIKNLLELAITKYEYVDRDVFQNNDQWYCFDAHSKLSSDSKEELIYKLNDGLKDTFQAVNGASHIIITLGTAWVYRLKITKKVVANCHKIPQKQFNKELLSIDDIKNALLRILNLVAGANSKAKVIFTVSPVRHLKDGFVENTLSKSHLISAIHQAIKDNAAANACYFPSYEIMMDELRDYRFYKEDMIHPSVLTVDYIWEKFKNNWISASSFDVMQIVDDIRKGLHHKPFNAKSEAHIKFLERLQEKITQLKSSFPEMIF